MSAPSARRISNPFKRIEFDPHALADACEDDVILGAHNAEDYRLDDDYRLSEDNRAWIVPAKPQDTQYERPMHIQLPRRRQAQGAVREERAQLLDAENAAWM
ncbi:hypothetical protein K488DRAFT_84566 [Vararia minispora EC-137]|uniref:Uncharacterized protein n=1 Tax=Vararia minispora EC-137 TaxID=1314806 RepID=A0ACB8QQ86_9AGAM|nr:hypothetical protein K488DRAFT_84566 [Vararia minispora EC-137]